jgi:hypothetical protein
MKRKRLPPDDPREWINRAKSNLPPLAAVPTLALRLSAMSASFGGP